jgi:SAM-dependent methyltransferase
MPRRHGCSPNDRVCLPTLKLDTIARTMGFVVLAAWILLPAHVPRIHAQTETSAEDSDCPPSNAPERADHEFEFDQTLGTSQDIDPFGPTPHGVVAQMLKMAQVGKGDVVYDLGSGDGRIPIAAAKQAGARGVGIELRSELVQESRETAEQEGVAELVEFIETDFFKSDLRSATALLLYLYPRTLLKLRPKLLDELRPGTRIVAYNYGIEGWPRDKEQAVEDAETYFDGTLYFWVVPANVSGSWQGSIETELGETHSFTLQLEQSFQKVSGKVLRGDREMPMKEVQLSGNTLRFSLDLPGNESLSLAATVDGHQLEGHAERVTPESGGQRPATRMPWQAKRDPATRTSIDPDQRQGR